MGGRAAECGLVAERPGGVERLAPRPTIVVAMPTGMVGCNVYIVLIFHVYICIQFKVLNIQVLQLK